MPCSSSFRSTKATSWALCIALSSTRLCSRYSVSSADAPHLSSRSRIVDAPLLVAAADSRWNPLPRQAGEPQAEVDHGNVVQELIAPGVAAQRVQDGEAG